MAAIFLVENHVIVYIIMCFSYQLLEIHLKNPRKYGRKDLMWIHVML